MTVNIENYLKAGKKASDWLVSNQREDGCINRGRGLLNMTEMLLTVDPEVVSRIVTEMSDDDQPTVEDAVKN